MSILGTVMCFPSFFIHCLCAGFPKCWTILFSPRCLRSLGCSESTWLYKMMDVWIILGQGRMDLNISSLHHRRQVTATNVLYKMHTSLRPPDLKVMLPQPCLVWRAIRTSLSMPRAEFSPTLLFQLWNALPDSVTGEINDNDTQSFKSRVHHRLIFTVAGSSTTSF